MRAAVSDRFIVGFRMTLDQCLTGGLGPDEMIEIARSLASTGASTSSASAPAPARRGCRPPTSSRATCCPEGVFNERRVRFRRAVGVPTLVAGRNVEASMAEEVLAGGVVSSR